MKKLLSLLSVLTISGTAIPTTIAASPYQKEDLKLENNLENINHKIQKRNNNENNKINITKIVIKANNRIFPSGVVLNNKLYFGSRDNNLYEYDPATGQQKIVITANKEVWSSGVVLNNKVYFGSHDHNVYEYDPATGQQKIVITTNGWVYSSGIVLNNKLYFGSIDNNVYEYDPATGEQKIVITANKGFWSSGVVLNNKVYFGSYDHNVYEYDPATGQQKIVIKANGPIRSNGVILNNKLYIGSHDHHFYEYDPATGQQKIVFTINNWIESSGVVLNNKIYFGAANNNVYEYSGHYLNLNLGQIDNNSDIVILNELNHLSPYLDISQLEIINKTDNLANIKIKNIFNNDFSIVNIKYSINNESNKIVNLNELIKKAIFFKFRDKNPNLIFKEINYIDTNNLNFSNVEVTKKSKLINNIDFKYPCSDKEVVNKTSNSKLFYVPGCEYNSKSELIFQIRKGINKYQEKNKENIWTLNSDDENKLIEFTYLNNKDVEIINTLSNDFVFSNLSEQKQEMILNMFRETDSRFELNPNEKLKINYSVTINKSEIILNLKQKITGIISAKIIDDNNEEKKLLYQLKKQCKSCKDIIYYLMKLISIKIIV